MSTSSYLWDVTCQSDAYRAGYDTGRGSWVHTKVYDKLDALPDDHPWNRAFNEGHMDGEDARPTPGLQA